MAKTPITIADINSLSEDEKRIMLLMFISVRGFTGKVASNQVDTISRITRIEFSTVQKILEVLRRKGLLAATPVTEKSQ